MPFLRAGFNARNTDTGIRCWTSAAAGHVVAVAELRRFACGDYFWYGVRRRKGAFLAWPERVVVHSHPHLALPFSLRHGLEVCCLPD